MFRAFIIMVVFYVVLVPIAAFAGSLDSPGAPSAGSGMPTLQGICTQLDTGVPAPLMSGPFAEPSAGPGSTMCTLTQISAKAPMADVAGAGPGDVLSGKKYWGLFSGSWGRQTGTLSSGSNVTGGNGLLTFPIPAGYYSGKTATASDSNLSSGNIKSGVSIFGVSGSVTQASGTATAGDVLSGMTFSNTGGSGISGTMPNQGLANFTPAATAVPVPAGYYSGGQVNGDANLASGNIKSGVSIFGVSGDPAVVDTSSAIALSGDLKSGKTAYVNGALVTGTLYGGCTCSGTMNGTRWCDNGNGTVTDLLGGSAGVGKCLVWLKDAIWGGTTYPWDTSMFDKVSTLANGAALSGTPATLTDGSAAGDWRMPVIAELTALTTGTEAVLSGTPRAFNNVQRFYWSGSSVGSVVAWYVDMGDGGVGVAGKDDYSDLYVWPVRSGQ